MRNIGIQNADLEVPRLLAEFQRDDKRLAARFAKLAPRQRPSAT